MGPIAVEYNIKQVLSESGNNMKQLHTIIHQGKTWLRSVHSWVHKEHIERYLLEYCFRINRSIHKQTIFHKLIERMVEAKPYDYQMIKISN
jgi:hypothetical protein